MAASKLRTHLLRPLAKRPHLGYVCCCVVSYMPPLTPLLPLLKSSPQWGSHQKCAITSVELSGAAWRSEVRKQRRRERVWTPPPEWKLCSLFMNRTVAQPRETLGKLYSSSGQMNCSASLTERNDRRQSTVLHDPAPHWGLSCSAK